MLTNKPIIKATIALMTITAVVKVLGYIEKIVLAYFYGTGSEVDVYLLITSIILAFFVFFRELLEPGFLTVFLKMQVTGSNKAWRFFKTVGGYLFLASLVIVLFSIGFSERLIGFFAPGFDVEKKSMAAHLAKYAFPALFFLILTNLTSITLNSQKRFILPAIGDVVFKAVSILALVLLYHFYGITGGAIGLVIGAALKLLVHVAGLWKNISVKTEELVDRMHYNELLKLSFPLLLGMLLSQSTLIVDNWFASFMADGTIAALSYSKKVVEMPVVVFPYVLSIVVFPYFAKFSVENDKKKLTQLFYDSIGWITWIFVPLSVFFCLFATPIVEVLFQRGAFSATSTSLTAAPLMIYSLGMWPFAVETVLVLIFFGMSDTRTPVMVGIFCVLVNIAVTYLLIGHLQGMAIALALVISKTLKVCILTYFLFKRLSIGFSITSHFLFKVLIAAIVAAVVWFGLIALRDGGIFPVPAKPLYFLIFSFIAGWTVYILLCFLLRMRPLLNRTFGDF